MKKAWKSNPNLFIFSRMGIYVLFAAAVELVEPVVVVALVEQDYFALEAQLVGSSYCFEDSFD